ncbi:MAG: ribosome-associated translation inhibitor RaiA [Anaerolineae bacterium]|nr:ribosome-associated translation inhibitor RaiA [Anaerolineae bacterium]
MQITIHAKNTSVSDRLQEYAEKKLGKLDRYLPNIARVDLEIGAERSRNGGDKAIAQLTVRHSRGTILRAEDKTQSEPYAAVDLVIDKMYRQISRYKGKRQHRADRAEMEAEWAGAEPLPDEAELAAEDEQAATISRRKRIDIAPMNEEEAIEQMELLGHDFFVFYNIESKSLNVLYRRKEGNYGLIDPVFGR